MPRVLAFAGRERAKTGGERLGSRMVALRLSFQLAGILAPVYRGLCLFCALISADPKFKRVFFVAKGRELVETVEPGKESAHKIGFFYFLCSRLSLRTTHERSVVIVWQAQVRIISEGVAEKDKLSRNYFGCIEGEVPATGGG